MLRRSLQRDRHAPAAGCELDRISYQVSEDLLESNAVAANRGVVTGQSSDDLHVTVRGRWLRRVRNISQDGVQVDERKGHAQLTCRGTRQIHELLNQPELNVGVALDDFESARTVGAITFAQHARPSQHRGQRSAQFV